MFLTLGFDLKYVCMAKIKHGFTGQRLTVLPFNTIEKALANPLTSGLVIHSMGFFPKAENHYIDRQDGCGQYVLIYCTKGEGWYRLDGKYHKVPANHFLYSLPTNPTSMVQDRITPGIFTGYTSGGRRQNIFMKSYRVYSGLI